MKHLWQYSANELAKGIAAGTFTSTEVVRSHLDRISEVNPSLNAISCVLADSALDAAADIDAAVSAGRPLGPLAGVPITIKENIDYTGSATTHGLPAFAEAVPVVNAPIVERVLAAGAIPVGRTNLPDYALRLHTDSALHGQTINPWNAARTTGGSSGGEAAALASGMSPLGLGNDVGGSLRNPATCCGIASIKPTQGVIPHAGTIPIEDEAISFQLMNSEGPMARRVADVRLGLQVLQGAHSRDTFSVTAAFNTVDRPLRIALMAEPPGGEVDARIATVTRKAAAALEAAGCIVTETLPPSFEEVVALWAALLDNDIALALPQLAPLFSADALTFVNDFRGERGIPTLASYATALAERAGLARQWARFFGEYDLLLSPTWTQLPFVAGWDIEKPGRAIETMQHARCVTPGNALGLPSACVPAGLVEGLPVGVLLTGARFSDHLCLDAADMVESALGLDTPINPR
ncbi:MAG: indole acetimide hydrolase [Spongiibacteraceae bacterium]|nr:indole acetimide hydrolase [Spongiibacteraceae bacterium]MBN51938.1 indole acetimide hydrolase [Spongiibacteraceae bacterium]